MDTQSTGFYEFLRKATPFAIIGFILSIIINYLLVNGMTRISPSSLGWPYGMAELVDGSVQVTNLIALVADIIIWTLLLAVISFMLLRIFGPKGQNI